MKTQIIAGQRIRTGILIGLLIALSIAFSGCTSLKIPRENGLFAKYDGELQRLDGDREWEMETWEERSNFSPQVYFMVRHPDLSGVPISQLDKMVYLLRVAWVRSEINAEGDILPADKNKWVNAPLRPLKVPVRLEPHIEDSTVVQVIPQTRLEPGLYTLQLRSPTMHLSARTGVLWPSVDRRTYASSNCVDRYLGDKPTYQLCADQEQVLASKWLKVHLVEPELRRAVDRQQQLVVKGVVVNTSQRPRRIPALEAQLLSAEGEIIKSWSVDATPVDLQPGASARFHSEIANPPPEARDIHVKFASPETTHSS